MPQQLFATLPCVLVVFVTLNMIRFTACWFVSLVTISVLGECKLVEGRKQVHVATTESPGPGAVAALGRWVPNN